MVCRGGIYPSRGTLRRHRSRGTISGLRAGPVARLASETRLRAQCKHRPLQRPDITAGPRFARLAAGPPLVVGEGFIPPAEPCLAANRADMESAPTGVCDGAGSAVSRRAAMLPRPVGRAFTPAAPWKFQKTGPCYRRAPIIFNTPKHPRPPQTPVKSPAPRGRFFRGGTAGRSRWRAARPRRLPARQTR